LIAIPHWPPKRNFTLLEDPVDEVFDLRAGVNAVDLHPLLLNHCTLRVSQGDVDPKGAVLDVRTIGATEADVKSEGKFQVMRDASMSSDAGEVVDVST